MNTYLAKGSFIRILKNDTFISYSDCDFYFGFKISCHISVTWSIREFICYSFFVLYTSVLMW